MIYKWVANVHNPLNGNSVMDRNELLKEIKAYQAQFKELYINDFQHGREKMNILNPYFGYKPVSPYEYNNGYGVRSLWMAIESSRMVVEARPRGYGGNEVRYETDKMTERQLDGIRVLVKTLYEERMKDIERTQANPKLETLLPEINEYAQRCIKAAGELFTVQLSKGRRQCDGPNEYHALVIEKEGWQIGSIPLRQDKYGKLTYNSQRPLCGESGDMEFTPEDWQDKIKGAMEEVVGGRIYMELADSPVSKVEVSKNYRDEFYISCKINGEQQMRKKLTDKDRSDYLSTKWNSTPYYLDVTKRELAEKYYKPEIELANSRTESRGIGR